VQALACAAATSRLTWPPSHSARQPGGAASSSGTSSASTSPERRPGRPRRMGDHNHSHAASASAAPGNRVDDGGWAVGGWAVGGWAAPCQAAAATRAQARTRRACGRAALVEQRRSLIESWCDLPGTRCVCACAHAPAPAHAQLHAGTWKRCPAGEPISSTTSSRLQTSDVSAEPRAAAAAAASAAAAEAAAVPPACVQESEALGRDGDDRHAALAGHNPLQLPPRTHLPR
jgi:hypothetical protein